MWRISVTQRAIVTPALATLCAVGISSCSNAYGRPSFMPTGPALSLRDAARPKAPAGSAFTVLYEFSGGSDGDNPDAGLIKVGRLLYGTTVSGGDSACSPPFGCGTVYSINRIGKEKVLYRFAGGSDGIQPEAGLTNLKGLLYGTTPLGGGSGCGGAGCGTVYSISEMGVENVLHRFSHRDGRLPLAGLTNVNGELYGTTLQGAGTACGGAGCGTVYRISTAGVEKVLHQFGRHGDGVGPSAGLIEMNGKLYGTTAKGGGSGCGGAGCGTVYLMTAAGAERVLHRFTDGSDGAFPGGLTKLNGTLYGTTQRGGHSPECAHGCGTVYSIKPNGVETVLYRFKAGSDGSLPIAALINVNGTLYGTTLEGGGTDCDGGLGCGTIYSVSTAGREKVLHAFADYTGFSSPTAPLIFVKGVLYGTTQQGGEGCYGPGCGTFFALSLYAGRSFAIQKPGRNSSWSDLTRDYVPAAHRR
jgi:uncharacterized repeat protein (TIGR03803 family)